MIDIYLFDNIIQYKQKEEIKEFIMPKNAMKYGKVKNIPIFEKQLEKLAKKERWLTLLKARKIHIILPSHYNEVDKEVILVIFNNIGLKKIKCNKELNYLELKKNQILINVHNDYLTLLRKEKNKIITGIYPYDIFENFNHTIEYILKKFSTKYRYYFLGNNNIFIKFIETKKQKNLYYFQNHNEYIINKILPK